MEFHISRKARDKYIFDQNLFSINGNIIFANFHAARIFAQSINAKNDLINFPENAIQAGQINAIGLIDEIFHFVFLSFLKENRTTILQELRHSLFELFGKDEIIKTLNSFDYYFPNSDDYKESNLDILSVEFDEDDSKQEKILEEMLMLWITNLNPAMVPYSELFEDKELVQTTQYHHIMMSLTKFFKKQPSFGPDNQDIVTMLRTPAIEVPHSLSGQLEYIRQRWGHLLGSYLYKLLGSLDLIKEEQKVIFVGGNVGPTTVPDMSTLSNDTERFSPDSDWMPRVVMMAKNTYVWLTQLSKEYNQEIRYLNQIPDEALDQLKRWGFTGLWLIGLWERSKSSKRIKQLCGNPDAVASAYSLSNYSISEDLGGELAYQNLRERAAIRGIRLASDMVPNHMGIDSNWVYEHPEWFIQLDHSPYPSYSFNGTDLSENPDISINLEDHYYNRSDAAVVFKRYDHRMHKESFIYHGNDGTTMPWNDTAQLNYLIPEVREAVIQTILDVARRFPIIRFDAAMTLAKKHYQRLWFPQPGSGGAIPSRSEFGLTKEGFDNAFPEEFWRDVVDRVAQEVPDTLLLAEAFWLMEGYFVRTLGMHRVYNSAFMNMLRNEENDKYRQLIKNTLQFDPQILKRYVNFMNNPDERTAVEQFGKDNKYFGICTLMSTMPGLPMFGHGQIEGYSEKYGMEYYRPYWDETPDGHLIQRHEREIFPILHDRYLFADVEKFLFFDFFTPGGWVDENVFAYTNGSGSKRALVVFHNKFSSTTGWIKISTDFLLKSPSGDDNKIIHSDLYSGLNLKGFDNAYVIFRDQRTNLEHIRSCKDIKENGIYIELEAYDFHVFLNFREVQDEPLGQYYRLEKYLNGRGVPSIAEALKELILSPILIPMRNVINSGNLDQLRKLILDKTIELKKSEIFNNKISNYDEVLEAIQNYSHLSLDRQKVLEQTRRAISGLIFISKSSSNKNIPGFVKISKVETFFQRGFSTHPELMTIFLLWIFYRSLSGTNMDRNSTEFTRSLIDEWNLGPLTESILVDSGLSVFEANNGLKSIKFMVSQQFWYDNFKEDSLPTIFETWLNDDQIRSYLGVNRYQDILWYNKEAFESLIWYMHAIAWLSSLSDPTKDSAKHIEDMVRMHEIIKEMLKAGESSECQVAILLENLK
ncbi:MAG: alpha-amylase family glycosyl hydrolase [Anaerolineaceae bacterium]|nr:alpha-amylase family glycosyl hydrolase [Anaerolineaceae bacterium]